MDLIKRRKASRAEARNVHMRLGFPESRIRFRCLLEQKTDEHNAQQHHDKQKLWRSNFFKFLPYHRTLNYLDTLTPLEWEEFNEDSNAMILSNYSEWKSIDFLINARFRQTCKCTEAMTPDQLALRNTRDAEAKYSTDRDSNARTGDPHFGYYKPEDAEKRVWASTSFENNARLLKTAHILGKQVTKDSSDLPGCMGTWTFNEMTAQHKSGREANLALASDVVKTGKTHLTESLLGIVSSLPGADHLIHRTSNDRFAHESGSRERAQRYISN